MAKSFATASEAFDHLLDLAERGIAELFAAQRRTLGW